MNKFDDDKIAVTLKSRVTKVEQVTCGLRIDFFYGGRVFAQGLSGFCICCSRVGLNTSVHLCIYRLYRFFGSRSLVLCGWFLVLVLWFLIHGSLVPGSWFQARHRA